MGSGCVDIARAFDGGGGLADRNVWQLLPCLPLARSQAAVSLPGPAGFVEIQLCSLSPLFSLIDRLRYIYIIFFSSDVVGCAAAAAAAERLLPSWNSASLRAACLVLGEPLAGGATWPAAAGLPAALTPAGPVKPACQSCPRVFASAYICALRVRRDTS